MTVDPKLLQKLEDRLELGTRQVNRLITERARSLLIPREEAAVALALESKVSIPRRLLTPEVLTTIRNAAGATASQPATAPPTSQPAKRAATAKKPTARTRRQASKSNRKRVMVVHGRDEARRRSMFGFLRSIGLDPIEFGKATKATKKGAPYIGEILDQAFKDSVAVVVMLTPDDQARLQKEFQKATDPAYEKTLTGQARPNVFFEAGMAFSRHQDSTVLVEIGELRPFSDVSGRHVVRLANHAESRRELANRLEAAGCDVDLDGSDWLSEGDFG